MSTEQLTPELSIQTDSFLCIFLHSNQQINALAKQQRHVYETQALERQAAVSTLRHLAQIALMQLEAAVLGHTILNKGLIVQELQLGNGHRHIIRRQLGVLENAPDLLGEHIQIAQANNHALVLLIKHQVLTQSLVQKVHRPIVVDRIHQTNLAVAHQHLAQIREPERLATAPPRLFYHKQNNLLLLVNQLAQHQFTHPLELFFIEALTLNNPFDRLLCVALHWLTSNRLHINEMLFQRQNPEQLAKGVTSKVLVKDRLIARAVDLFELAQRDLQLQITLLQVFDQVGADQVEHDVLSELHKLQVVLVDDVDGVGHGLEQLDQFGEAVVAELALATVVVVVVGYVLVELD